MVLALGWLRSILLPASGAAFPKTEGAMNFQPNISIFERDSSHFSVQLLVQALERNDQANLTVLAKSVLRSTYDHLFFSYSARTTENGPAMSSLLILQSQLHE
jgi:hypothetical protein